MKLFVYVICIAVLCATVVAVGDALTLNLDNQPPVIIRTFPESGAKNVDPLLSEIQVTFSKEMMDKSWSWVQVAPENFPELIGEPRATIS